MDLFRRIIDDAATCKIKEIGLNFYNEPLLDPLLFERIKYAKSKKMRVIFSSNGTMLGEEKINKILNSGIDSITFSFDGGTKEVYEKIRIGANFEKTRDNIIGLIKERNRRKTKKPSIFINFVAQMENYDEIHGFEAFWKGLADGINVTLVDNRLKDGLLPSVSTTKKEKKRLYPCRRIFGVMNVMSNGKVALCCRDFDGSVILGDLNKENIYEVYNSIKWQQLRSMHFNGNGDKVNMCYEIQCPDLFRTSVFSWWIPEQQKFMSRFGYLFFNFK
jgi:MoaA/NifB/PqqE/SkfB family radical SAM enzyme